MYVYLRKSVHIYKKKKNGTIYQFVSYIINSYIFKLVMIVASAKDQQFYLF